MGSKRNGRPDKCHFAYLVRCSDGSYYGGYTTDPLRREREHNSGRGAKYTRSRTPVELVYTEAFDTKEEAMRREWILKRLSHGEKAALAAGWKRRELQMPEQKQRARCGGRSGMGEQE